MNTLSGHVEDYVRLRRALGFKLERAGHLLPKLVDYLEADGSATLTTELAISWARLPANARPNHWAARLTVARGFARYLQTIEPATEVPPASVFPARRHRPAPYLWSQQDIHRLLDGARALRPQLRAATHEALFGLLAVSGMRVGEAVGLDRDDVAFDTGVITIRHAKFDRSRLVPLHATTTAALRGYATERDRLWPRRCSTAFFVSGAGTRVGRGDVAKTLRRITSTMGLRTDTVHPTAHQLRHSFAVQTLIDWHRSGVRIDEHIAELDAPLIAAFLDHLEHDRHNSATTRNSRLAAIHSLFSYLALHYPEHAGTVQRVLAIPAKRTQRNLVTYLTEDEVDALLGSCDQSRWTGRRDHAMLSLTIQTGLRISELAGLDRRHVTLATGANVHTIGKGRKERRTPLVPATRAILKAWLREHGGTPTDPLFPTTTGRRLSPDAIERRLTHHLATAAMTCPSIGAKHISMHTLRHTAAMRLLIAGNDITVIALWLGHEQIATTNIYLHADMTHKQRAIDRTKPLAAKPGRYRPPDTLLAFLEAL